MRAGLFLFMAESLEEFFAKSGPLPVSLKDVRRFPRFYFRSAADAVIHPLRPGAEPTRCVVLTRDLSRNGLSLLHDAQLFPGQKVEVTLTEGPPRFLEVARCQRLEKDRYLVGCRFKKAEPTPPPPTEPTA